MQDITSEQNDNINKEFLLKNLEAPVIIKKENKDQNMNKSVVAATNQQTEISGRILSFKRLQSYETKFLENFRNKIRSGMIVPESQQEIVTSSSVHVNNTPNVQDMRPEESVAQNYHWVD